MSGPSSSGSSGSSYNPNTNSSIGAYGQKQKKKSIEKRQKEQDKNTGPSTADIVKASEGKALVSVKHNKVSDAILTGAGAAGSTILMGGMPNPTFKTDSQTYEFKDKAGTDDRGNPRYRKSGHRTTIRKTSSYGKTLTTNTVNSRTNMAGDVTEINGMSPTEFARQANAQSGSGTGGSEGSGATTTTTASKPEAEAQSTASANVPVYDTAVEEAKVSAKRKIRRKGKRGLRVSKTAVGTGGAPASGLSIPKG